MARVRTGVPELDEMLRGGFMFNDAVMIAGSAGTGKTTLALQYLVNGITKFGENGIYLTFEQMPDQIYRDAEGFGWDLRKLEQEGKLKIVLTTPDLLLEDSDQTILREQIKEIGAKRIVVDSLSHIAMFVDEKKLRLEAYRLIMFIKTKGLSSLYLWESPQLLGQSVSIAENGLSFLVDCIVLLKTVEIDSALRKALVVLKMRGSDHDKRLREYQITSHGLEVFAPFDHYQGIMSGSPMRAAPSDKFMQTFLAAAELKGKRGEK